jgi:hypothetical protein
MRSSPKELFASSLHSLKAKRKRSLLSFGLFFDVAAIVKRTTKMARSQEKKIVEDPARHFRMNKNF